MTIFDLRKQSEATLREDLRATNQAVWLVKPGDKASSFNIILLLIACESLQDSKHLHCSPP